ncbi:PH domain-containing protein [Kribbia dieselivorans]|uniref:PH domain-containing protein n=1 Tax=Kribbia dieselivorans TaxID=331526 RepID=UPI0008393064|nr:PH domain-containing protein [Kribbia dieselivorans]
MLSISQHWVVLAKPVAILVAATVLALYLDATVPASAGASMRFVWLLWLAALGYLLWCLLEWRSTVIVVTNKRILKLHGLIDRRASMMPMAKVTDMTYHRSILGRILGFGKFVLESAGQDQALRDIDHVPHPDASYRAIVAQIFGDDTHDEDDGADHDHRHDDDPDTDELPPYDDQAVWTEAEWSQTQWSQAQWTPTERAQGYKQQSPAPYDRHPPPPHDPRRWR